MQTFLLIARDEFDQNRTSRSFFAISHGKAAIDGMGDSMLLSKLGNQWSIQHLTLLKQLTKSNQHESRMCQARRMKPIKRVNKNSKTSPKAHTKDQELSKHIIGNHLMVNFHQLSPRAICEIDRPTLVPRNSRRYYIMVE